MCRECIHKALLKTAAKLCSTNCNNVNYHVQNLEIEPEGLITQWILLDSIRCLANMHVMFTGWEYKNSNEYMCVCIHICNGNFSLAST